VWLAASPEAETLNGGGMQEKYGKYDIQVDT
jgi:hypothetical protein